MIRQAATAILVALGGGLVATIPAAVVMLALGVPTVPLVTTWGVAALCASALGVVAVGVGHRIGHDDGHRCIERTLVEHDLLLPGQDRWRP